MAHGSVVGGVICADGHFGYSQPVGGVVAYTDHLSVSGVGYDIACGNFAVRLDARFSDLTIHVKQITDDIQRPISFGFMRTNTEEVDHMTELPKDTGWRPTPKKWSTPMCFWTESPFDYKEEPTGRIILIDKRGPVDGFADLELEGSEANAFREEMGYLKHVFKEHYEPMLCGHIRELLEEAEEADGFSHDYE